MGIFKILVLLALVSVIFTSNVKNLTTSNFNQTIQNNKYVMVKFYAPWCTHCKNMVPQYQKLAQLAKDNGIIIGQVDVTQQQSLGKQWNIQGFPTIKFFADQVPIDYKGARKTDQMYSWIKTIAQAQVKQISYGQIQKLRAKKQNFVVYSGNNDKKRNIFSLLTAVDASIKYFTQPSDQQKVYLFIAGKQSINYPSDKQFSIQNIKKWALVNSLQTVVNLKTKQRLDYVFYDPESTKDVALLLRQNNLSDQTFNKIQNICEKNKDKIKCGVVDKQTQIYGGVKSYLKSKGNSVLALTRDTLKQAYKYTKPLSQITQQLWNQFVKQVQQKKHPNLGGTETDYIDYQHVKYLGNQNYTSFMKQNQVVFVQYIATGCAVCVEFSQNYDALAKQIYEDKNLNVEVTAIDLKKNMDIAAQLKIFTHPSFRLYLSGAYVDYKGPMDKTQMLNYIRKALQANIIQVNSIAQVPSPSVLIYDPSQISSLKHLPGIFTRYPVYQLKQGSQVKVVLRGQQQKTFPNDVQLNVSSVSRWLLRQTDPVLVNMLVTNVDGKLKDALQNQIHLLGIIDVEPEISASLRKTMEQYCKNSPLVCGYAKKGEEHFEQLMTWAGIDKDVSTSELIYINTQTFDKYIFTEKIEQLNVQKIEQFVSDIKAGKIKTNDQKAEQQKAQTQTNKSQQQKQQNESVSKSQESPNESEL